MTLSLRDRLVIAMVTLLAVAVLAIDVTAVASLRAYLTDQIDDQLLAARGPIARSISSMPEVPERHMAPNGPDTSIARQPPSIGVGRSLGVSDFYIEIRRADGTVETRVSPLLREEDDPAPDVSADLANSKTGKGPFTVTGVGDHDVKYRAVVSAAPDGAGTVIIAAPLDTINNTVRRLVGVEIVATLTALLVLAGIGWSIIRNDLRPLEDMAETATAIAAGDLSKRVERADDSTEVGRLGAAMNVMLNRIETSVERLRRFAADASHELRTPLTSIRGYAELYRHGAVTTDEDLARVMSRIESEAERMGLIVDDLLLLARLDQSRPLEQEVVELDTVAGNAVFDAHSIDPERWITLERGNEPVIVIGDSARLHQVVANLISNALVHTPPETPVTVTVESDDNEAILKVSDTGPGLSPEVKEKIFERFYRSDSGRSRDTGGTGLGLAIVQSLVVAHNGSVDVQSEPGEGATFIVRLPLAVSED